jgi:hypothetical protein
LNGRKMTMETQEKCGQQKGHPREAAENEN